MSEELIREDLGEGLVRLTLNRRPVNALTAPFLTDFVRTLNELADDDTVRAIVLSSAFATYSAGLDLKAAQSFDLADEAAIVEALNTGFLTQFTFPKPLVAAVNGPAIAGGMFFVLASDWRVCGPTAQVGLAEVRVGADLPLGPLEIARATLDPNDLRRLLLTGQPMSAQAALERGIVDELCAADQVDDRAIAKARELADLPSKAYGAMKRGLRGPAVARIQEGMAQMAQGPTRAWFNEDTKDAMKRMIR